ncbi:MAG: hypothetical protein FGF48_11325 [Candidatus Brockarchaeota archaeon]|nr:hypothetical protein [Candidatus Brockarchaeota archaeon]
MKYFKEILKISDENLVNKLAKNYREVLDASTKDLVSAEEVEKTGDGNLLGKFGELWIIKLVIEECRGKLKDIHYKVYVNNEERYLDIVLEDAIVESKYWPSEDTYKKHLQDTKGFEEFIGQIKACWEAREQLNKDKVYLVFGRKGVISDAEFNGYAQKIRDALGEDASWLVICNGFYEFVKAYGG